MTKGKTISSSKWYLLGRTLCRGTPLNIWNWILFLRTIQPSLHITSTHLKKLTGRTKCRDTQWQVLWSKQLCLTTFATSKTMWYLITEHFIQLLQCIFLFFWLLRSSVCTFEDVLGQADSCIFIAPWLDHPFLGGCSSFFCAPNRVQRVCRNLTSFHFLLQIMV